MRTMIVGIAIILALVFGDSAYGALTARWRMSDELRNVTAPVNLVIYLPFEAQRYHTGQLRQYGTFAGRQEDGGILLARVSQEDLERLSRQFWIERMEIIQ